MDGGSAGNAGAIASDSDTKYLESLARCWILNPFSDGWPRYFVEAPKSIQKVLPLSWRNHVVMFGFLVEVRRRAVHGPAANRHHP